MDILRLRCIRAEFLTSVATRPRSVTLARLQPTLARARFRLFRFDSHLCLLLKCGPRSRAPRNPKALELTPPPGCSFAESWRRLLREKRRISDQVGGSLVGSSRQGKEDEPELLRKQRRASEGAPRPPPLHAADASPVVKRARSTSDEREEKTELTTAGRIAPNQDGSCPSHPSFLTNLQPRASIASSTFRTE